MKINIILFSALALSIFAAHVYDNKTIQAKTKYNTLIFPKV